MTAKKKQAGRKADTDDRPKMKIDGDTGEISAIFEDEGLDPQEQLWNKNPRRTRAMRDLWYDDMMQSIEEDPDMSQEAKMDLQFMMATNSVLDLVMDSLPEDLAMELSFCLDSTLGLAIVNKRNRVDLMEEYYKALEVVKREDYSTDDEYERALEALEDHWWSIGQPALGMRSANDSIIEALSKYGLNE